MRRRSGTGGLNAARAKGEAMRVEKRSQIITIGEGEKAITLEVECDPEGRPLTVRMLGGERTSAEVIERVAAVLEKLRGYDQRQVCLDHGYFGTNDSYRCPGCEPKDCAEKAAA